MARMGVPITNLLILNPHLSGGNFIFSYATVAGHQYYVESRNSLTAAWQSGTAVAGDGSIKTVSVPVNGAPALFYRIRAL